MAKKLLERFKILGAVFGADIKDLEKILGKAKASKFTSLVNAKRSEE
jgi:DNA repair protein RadC